MTTALLKEHVSGVDMHHYIDEEDSTLERALSWAPCQFGGVQFSTLPPGHRTYRDEGQLPPSTETETVMGAPVRGLGGKPKFIYPLTYR